MARSVAVLLLVTILSAAMTAFGQPEVTFGSVTFKGSGCDWSNTDYALSDGNKVVTFLFGGMIATTDSGLAGMRKNCVISLKLNYPDGWSYSVVKVTGRGYAKLDDGVKGTYETSNFISGESGTEYVSQVFDGPLDLNYEMTERFKRSVWSQCNSARNVNLNIVVRVDGPPGANGLMTVDSVDNKFKLKYYFEWKEC